MFRRIVLPLVLLALAGGPLAAQPSAPARPAVPIIVRLLPFAADENFAKELKLTPEQVKALTDYRKKQWDEQYTTPSDKYAEGISDRNKATVELFQKTLSAEQHKRALQLATQTVLSSGFSLRGGFPGEGNFQIDLTRVPAMGLSAFPDLAAPLNLTDEQKKLVAARTSGPGITRTTVFLTAEQAKVVKEMTGEPVNLNWVSEFDERMNRSFRGGRFGNVPGLLELTEARDVRTDLGLTEEQTKTLADLAAKWQSPTASDRTLSPQAQFKANDDLQAASETALAAALKPEQLARLKQISMQGNGARFGIGGPGQPAAPSPLTARMNNPEVRKALTVTDAQVKSFTDADKALDAATEKAVLADGPVDDAIKALDAARTARDKAYETAVTAEQKKALDDLLGKPFAGSIVPDRIIGSGGQPSPAMRNMRAATFGKRLLVELRLLANNKAIQDDLGLKTEQLKAITDKGTEANTKFGSGFGGRNPTQDLAALQKAMAEQSEFVEKALADIFTAEQSKRWRELLIQRLEFLTNPNRGGPGRNASVGAVAAPGVAEAVKLTAEQKTKLLDEGGKPDEVLTAEQKAKMTELAGKKYDGNFTVGPGGGAPGGGPLISRPTTVAVLRGVPPSVFKITPEQADKLAAALNRYQLETLPEPPMQVEGGGFRPVPVGPEKLAAANETLTKAVAAILSAEQLARVEQVKYQAVAQTAGMNLFAQKDVATALSLTKEQTDKHAALVTDVQRLTNAAGIPFALGLNGFNGSGFTPWMDKFTEKTTAKATTLLTAEQKAAWQKLTGDPVPNLPRNLASQAFGGGFSPF